MKKFAGVDFDLYDIEALTPAEMNHIMTNFLKHHNYMSTYAAQCEKGAKIIEHMNNYFCLQSGYSDSPDETMAYLIKYLPCSSRLERINIDYVLLNLVRLILEKYNYKNLDFVGRLEIVEKEKRMLNFNDEWHSSVEQIYDSARRHNIEVAYAYLEEIEMLTSKFDTNTNTDYAACVFSMQTVIYIKILEFLQGTTCKFADAETSVKRDKFYNIVHDDLVDSIKSLLAVLGYTKVETKPTTWSGMIFSYYTPKETPLELASKEQRRHAKLRNIMQA